MALPWGLMLPMWQEGALAAGEATVAVLGTGCDQIYPRRHWRLAERIQGERVVAE
ncbi:MAG: DNA-processing protein DprA [Candidatus Azotimanducaceae bacterium WSBS_2022_MAG_OTU7]